MGSDVFTIREMCDAFEVTPRTLRFYEDKDLLSPAREGQKRLYSRRDQARLKLVLQGKRFGFSLDEISELLDLYDLGDQQRTQLLKTQEVALKRLEEMKSKKRDLESAITDLENHIDRISAHIGSEIEPAAKYARS